MDAYMLWLGNSIAGHISTHLRPAMTAGLWLLVHSLTIVSGDAPDAESKGGAELAMPDSPNAEPHRRKPGYPLDLTGRGTYRARAWECASIGA